MVKSPKGKGNAAERWAADLLTEWYGEEFKRIPNSGALRWGGSCDHFGDLLVPQGFRGLVEVKHRKNFDLLAPLTRKPGKDNILGWWLQAVGDAQRCKADLKEARCPILIAKGNRSTPVICVEKELGDILLRIYPHLLVTNASVPSFYITTLDQVWLKAIKPVEFQEAAKSISHAVLDWRTADGTAIG